jgi:tetratricopeptide (TPR) repeat protein
VSGPLFDQYKAALRRGHMAALGGDLDAALDAYREAARLVPERTLPLASQGTVLHRLGRWPEAAQVFESALQQAPDDEPTLRARATAREERGMHSGAAADYERLAFVLDVAGRAPEAIAAARKANELEARPARASLAARLERAAGRTASSSAAPSAPPDADAAAELEGAAELAVAAEVELAAEVDVAAQVEAAAEVEAATPPDVDTAAASEEQLAPDDGTVGADEPMFTPVMRRVVPETDAEVARAAQHADPSASWPQMDMPTPEKALVGPRPDTEQLLAEASAMFDVGDLAGASERMLTAVAVHRAAGRLDAALDVCFQLLAIAPGDPHAHLAIANLQLDRGWTPLAREKIDLLLRLTSLTGDTQAEADTHGLAAERLRDDPVGSVSGR